MKAMKVEYEALMKNKTWDLVPYPNEKNVIGNKWIYKVKFNSVGDIEKYKALDLHMCLALVQVLSLRLPRSSLLFLFPP